MKTCVLGLHDACIGCGTCDDRCERDVNKVCDNCFACLEPAENFARIEIDAVYTYVETDIDQEGES